jgi:hypothetical protein
MGQSFCNQCGTRLDASDRCANAACVAYSPPAAVVALAPAALPPASDLFAEPPAPATGPLPAAAATDGDRDWIAAGEASQNEVYLGNRLLFQAPDGSLNGSPEQLILQSAAIRLAIITMFVFGLSLIAGVVLALVSGPRLAIAVFFLLNLAVFVAQLLLPARIPVSEWMLLLDGKGGAAESAFAQIADAFRRRQSPAAPTVRRISFRGPGGVGAFAAGAPPVRNYLAVTYGHITGYISAFPFGNDLYVGWTLWWQQRPARSLWNLLRQTIAGALGRDVQFQLMLRADDAKALRELMHSAAREGIDVAARGLTVSLAGTVGANVPVESFQPAFEE